MNVSDDNNLNPPIAHSSVRSLSKKKIIIAKYKRCRFKHAQMEDLGICHIL